jgi:Ca2+-binding RTX toxin-like protein
VSRLRPRVALLALLLALGGGETATAAPPQNLGQNPISTAGGCTLCSVVQLSNSTAPNIYVFPADGVLTRSSFYVGPVVEAPDFVQPRVFRKTGGSSAIVVSEGPKHPLNGLSAGIHTYFERIPGRAGDVLGARFDTVVGIEGTPHIFTTASADDQAGYISIPDANPELGDPFTSAPIANRRVNVSARFEPDEDGDGYGDTSQDLCPGASAAITACSGTLLGSRLQGPYKTYGACGYACMRVQTTVDGASTASPLAGVVVRWRVLGAAGNYRIRVLGPTGGSNYSILRSSDLEQVESSPFTAISTFAVRLPIPAGGYVGLVPPPFTTQLLRETAPGSSFRQVNDGADGSSTNFDGFGSPIVGEILYDADVEPDADGDGFGDLTQDSCPTDGSYQGACPQPPVPVAPVDEPSKPFCGGKRATKVGTAGKDDLRGTKRADVIVGLGGDDTVRALAGNDLVCAGKGKDTVLGGPGRDRLLGEGGVDALRGGPGKDKLVGGPGKDLQRQ